MMHNMDQMHYNNNDNFHHWRVIALQQGTGEETRKNIERILLKLSISTDKLKKRTKTKYYISIGWLSKTYQAT